MAKPKIETQEEKSPTPPQDPPTKPASTGAWKIFLILALVFGFLIAVNVARIGCE